MTVAPKPAAVTEVKTPRKTRSPSAPKAVYTVLQVLDEAGEPVKFDKSRIRIVSFEKSAEAVLDKTEGGSFPFAFYLRGTVPPGR